MHTIPASQVECQLQSHSKVGECPTWSMEEQCLYWIDIEGRLFHRWDPSSAANESWKTPERFGSFGLRQNGSFVVATENGFHFFDPISGDFLAITDPESDKPNNRFNDGRVDRAGRFWAGSMIDQGTNEPNAALYCLDTNGEATLKQDGIILANGLAWDPDNSTMYFADTRMAVVWAYDFDLDDAALSNRRVFIEFKDGDGAPDGAAIDTDGCYWLTQPRSWTIKRYTPAGKVDTVIELPFERPTMCAFGGADLKTLYITSLGQFLNEGEKIERPLEGGVFKVDVEAQGLPEPYFEG